VLFHTESRIGKNKLEKTPEIENKYTELSSEDKIAEIEKIKSLLSDEEIEKVFTIKSEKSEPVKEVEAPVPESKPFIKLDPQIEMVAQTLMASAEEKVKTIYKDVDYSGIKNDPTLNTLQKVTLMSSVVEPNAKRMANIEKNLKSNDAEGTEKKQAEFSAPAKSGKVDEEAGKKLFTELSAKLGFSDEEKS